METASLTTGCLDCEEGVSNYTLTVLCVDGMDDLFIVSYFSCIGWTTCSGVFVIADTCTNLDNNACCCKTTFIFSTKNSLNGMRNINFHVFFHSQRTLRHDLKCLCSLCHPISRPPSYNSSTADERGFHTRSIRIGYKLRYKPEGEIKVIYSTDSGMKSI